MTYRILVIDDFRISNEIVSDILTKEGYESISFQDAHEALSFLKKNTVDAVLTDYYMPRMNGLEFIEQLRALNEYASTPVFFLSSSNKKELLE